jgi:hypothetical protein
VRRSFVSLLIDIRKIFKLTLVVIRASCDDEPREVKRKTPPPLLLLLLLLLRRRDALCINSVKRHSHAD